MLFVIPDGWGCIGIQSGRLQSMFIAQIVSESCLKFQFFGVCDRGIFTHLCYPLVDHFLWGYFNVLYHHFQKCHISGNGQVLSFFWILIRACGFPLRCWKRLWSAFFVLKTSKAVHFYSFSPFNYRLVSWSCTYETLLSPFPLRFHFFVALQVLSYLFWNGHFARSCYHGEDSCAFLGRAFIFYFSVYLRVWNENWFEMNSGPAFCV